MKKIYVIFLFLILCCTQTTQMAFAKKEKLTIPAGSGYVGTLPNISDHFQASETEDAKPSFEYENGFNDQDDIKPAPKNNPAFINIIVKQDKTSQYINDLNSIIIIIEKMQTAIENNYDVQKFNAESYFLDKNVAYFRSKYKNQAEQSYISFKKVMQLNTHVQAIARLRLESEAYTPYVSTAQSGNLFTQNNINTQLDYLLDEIKQTVVVLKETK